MPLQISTANAATILLDSSDNRKSHQNARRHLISNILRNPDARPAFPCDPGTVSGCARKRQLAEDIRHATAAALLVRDGCPVAARCAARAVRARERWRWCRNGAPQ